MLAGGLPCVESVPDTAELLYPPEKTEGDDSRLSLIQGADHLESVEFRLSLMDKAAILPVASIVDPRLLGARPSESSSSMTLGTPGPARDPSISSPTLEYMARSDDILRLDPMGGIRWLCGMPIME
jgi:hypothetical protein